MLVRDFYSEIGPSYAAQTIGEALTVATAIRAMRTMAALAMLDRHISLPSAVADVGCGPAQLAGELVRRGHRYIGVDLVPSMFEKTAADFDSGGRASFVAGRMEQIPLADKSVNAVVCLGVIEYTAHYRQALREIQRVLAPAGVAIVSFPNGRNPVNLLRATLRPVLAPMLRVVAPNLSRTVYVSGIPHRIFDARAIANTAQSLGLALVEIYAHGYLPSPFNHRLPRRLIPMYRWIEHVGQRVLPTLGSNVVTCLRNV